MQMGQRTCECDFAGHFWQRGVDELLEIDLLILDVVERLAGTQGSFAKAQRAGGFVAVEGLDVQDSEGMGDIVGTEGGAFAVSHELERLLEHLGKAVVDVAGELVDDVVGEGGDAHGFGDVAHVVGIPHGRRHGAGVCGGWGALDGGGRECPRVP